MSISQRLKQFLDNARLPYHMELHPPAYTAEEIAEVAHVSGYDLAKVVIVVADGQHVMVVLPASHRIDMEALRKSLGAQELRLARESEFANEFPDCEIGAMPPFGQLYSLPVVASVAIRQDEDIYFNAGTHREMIRMKREDWELLAKPRWETFSRLAH